jgi:cytochrome b6-f complex iron-sulfur subunit
MKYYDKEITKISVHHSDIKNKRIPRKKFFQRIGLTALIPLSGIWFSTSKRAVLKEKQIKKVVIPPNIPTGISFHDSVIVSKKSGQIKIYSAKCTHLGCTINKSENNNLVCPCHGSQYTFDGKPVKGPANKNLNELPFKIDTQTGEIMVNVQV